MHSEHRPDGPASSGREQRGQLVQGIELQIRANRVGPEGVDVCPWPAPQERGPEPGGGGGNDVVVESLTDVQEHVGLAAGDVHNSREEVDRGLGDAPLRRGGDEVHVDTERA